MSGFFRGVLGLGLLVGSVWCSFHVPLGERTFSEHVDRIGQTPEARELLDGSRSTLSPVLEEATHRMLGEYVEAPTRLHSDDPMAPASATAEAVPESAGPPRPRSSRLPRAQTVRAYVGEDSPPAP